jgi:hypothetical protein
LSPAFAQAPELRVSPAARPGERIDTVLTGPAQQVFVTLLDGHGGPWRLFEQTLYLGLRQTVVVDGGSLGFGGFRATALPVPLSAPLGQPLYFQSLVLAGNRLQATDGESAVVVSSRLLIVQDYDDPTAAGITGSYDATVRGRVQAAGVRRRVHDVVPRQGVALPQAVLGPLNPFGVRMQSVYRAADIGATGDAEVLAAVRWKPATAVTADAIGGFDMRVAHSRVVPDYSIDPFSALPRYPDSGLDLRFASNVRPGDQLTTIYSGGYVIDPARQQADGYMPYPDLQQQFTYNGFDSLVLDFAVPPSTSTGSNGQQVYLMVQSSNQPHARAITAGQRNQLVTNPHALLAANTGECVWHELQLEFLCYESSATSPWLAAPSLTPDYGDPFVSSSVPAGTSASIEYRGAPNPDGRNATLWSPRIDVADGLRYLQYRIRFIANSGELRPSVDQIVIPVN